MCRRGNRNRIDARLEQTISLDIAAATECAADEIALLALGVRHANELHTLHVGEDPGMVAAHDADAHHSDAQCPGRAILRGLPHSDESSPDFRPGVSLACAAD